MQAVGVGDVGTDRDRLVSSKVSGFLAGPASISAMVTFAPSPANRIAVARPIPLPAPVMKATLPASLGTDHQDTDNDALGARADLARDPQRARRLINSGQPELMRLDGGSQPAYARQGARASGVGSEKYFETGGVGLLIYGAAQRRRRQ